MPRKQLIAKVNVVGPDGQLVLAGEPIPDEWRVADPEFIEHLQASGGARKKG